MTEVPTVRAPANGPGLGALWHALRSVRSPPEFEPLQWTSELRVAPHLVADVYLPSPPESATGVPSAVRGTVVVVHGGAFLIGDRRMKPARYFCTELTARGFRCVSLDYRLIFRGGRLTEAVADVVAGLRAAHVPGVPLYALGLSAGASLTLLGAAQVPEVERVVGAYGLWDFTCLSGRLARLLPRLLCETADVATWARRSPNAHRVEARALLLHGTDDALVPVGQAVALSERRIAGGLHSELVVVPGAPHGYFNHVTADTRAGLEAVCRFLEAP